MTLLSTRDPGLGWDLYLGGVVCGGACGQDGGYGTAWSTGESERGIGDTRDLYGVGGAEEHIQLQLTPTECMLNSSIRNLASSQNIPLGDWCLDTLGVTETVDYSGVSTEGVNTPGAT